MCLTAAFSESPMPGQQNSLRRNAMMLIIIIIIIIAFIIIQNPFNTTTKTQNKHTKAEQVAKNMH